jgi:hypothetical protein
MQWALMTLLDPTNSYANLAYVGYPGEFSSAFTVTRRRRVDRKKQHTQRNIFQCYVFGARGSGKTSLLQSFIGRYAVHFLISYIIFFHLVIFNSLGVLVTGNLLTLCHLTANALQQILLKWLM